MRKYFLICLLLVVVATSQAQRPDAPRYALPGAYAVGTREYTIVDPERTLNATVWYPVVPETGSAPPTPYRTGLLSIEGQARRDAEPEMSGAPYPLVVFSHGSGALRQLSLWFTEHLPSYGFVVIAVDHTGNTALNRLDDAAFDAALPAGYALRPEDVQRQIDFAEMLNEGDLAGLIDVERIAVAGHSFGGYTALAAGGARLNFDVLDEWCADSTGYTLTQTGVAPADAVETSPDNVCFLQDDAEVIAELRGLEAVPQGLWEPVNDPRVDAVIAFAPWNAPIFGTEGLAAVEVPTLIVVGSEDGTTPPERDAYRVYAEISSERKALMVFENGDHYLFIDECPPVLLQFGFFAACSDPVWDMTRAHDLTNHIATAFLLVELQGDAAAQPALRAVNFRGVQMFTTYGE